MAFKRQATGDTRKMLTPHVRAIGRPAGPAQDDAVDSARVEGQPHLRMGLRQATGRPYESFVFLLEELTR